MGKAHRSYIKVRLAQSVAVIAAAAAVVSAAQAPVNGIIPIQPVGGLGALLGPIYQAGVCVVDNSGNCSTSKSPLPNSVNLLNVALNATFSDLDIAKCYFANGTVGSISGCGAPAVAPPGYSLPSFNGLPNTTNSVYDLAFGVTNQPPQVPYGNSRPFQVPPSQLNQFRSSHLSGPTPDP